MRIDLLNILRCPVSGQRLALEQAEYRDGCVYSGYLAAGSRRYPIRNFVPRFVPESNYADSFGMQWNRFRQTQLDSHSGYPISAGRFWDATGWTVEELNDNWVLDVGCGAGRFAEIALEAGANVVAMDYSTAVDACYANLQAHSRIHVVQADIYALPFEQHAYPFVYSLGVLQHTPDVKKAFAALPRMVRRGGKLCVDFYERHWKSRLLPKYSLRPITKRMSKATLFSLLETAVPKLFPLSRQIGRLPMGHVLKRLIPVADPIYFYERSFGKTSMSPEERLSWALLDTFDWFSPEYDNPQRADEVRHWMESAGMAHVEVLKAGHLVARGTMP